MSLSKTLPCLDLRAADSGHSWPAHERRKRLGLRRLRNMLEADVRYDADHSGADAGEDAERKQKSSKSLQLR